MFLACTLTLLFYMCPQLWRYLCLGCKLDPVSSDCKYHLHPPSDPQGPELMHQNVWQPLSQLKCDHCYKCSWEVVRPWRFASISCFAVALKWNATDKIWDFSTTDVVIWMNQSVVPRYSLGWVLWGGLQDIKCAWFSLEGFTLNLSILNFLNNFFHGIWSRPIGRAFFSE